LVNDLSYQRFWDAMTASQLLEVAARGASEGSIRAGRDRLPWPAWLSASFQLPRQTGGRL